MISDDRYVFPTSVAMTSIAKNADTSVSYVLYLLCDNVSETNKKKLEHINSANCKIVFVDVDSSQYKNLEKSYSRVSSASLMKFNIATELADIDKALYLDGDVIVKSDLLELYSTELGENYAAVVKDGPKQFVPGGKQHSYYGSPDYFNSGVMLLNLRKMREDNIPQKLKDFRLNEYNYFMDQDAFNRVLGKKVLYVGVEYDFLLHLISYQNTELSIKQLVDFYNLREYRNYDELFSNVCIFHYTFGKPWKYYDVPFNEVWIEYYKQSPFKDKQLERVSIMTQMYNTKTYRFSRVLSAIVRKILFIK